MKKENYELLKNMAALRGAELFGVAKTAKVEKHIHKELRVVTAKLPRVISIGIRVQRAVLESLIDRPNLVYKTHYRQVNAQLDSITSLLASEIQRRGHKSIPIAASYIIEWKKQNAHVSHRHVALEAGLGFWGRNNLLVHPQFGAGIRLASLFTDMPLETGSRLEKGCGDCTACIASCPAGAIGENKFDYDKCFEMVHQFSKQNYYNALICGLCVKACVDACD